MARRRRYEELIVWQKAMDLVDVVYDLSEFWPQQELYRLTDQVRRAVVSVPANIAEGHGRTGRKEFLHHLSIAYGSLTETETLLSVAKRRRYLSAEQHESAMELADEVGRLALGMLSSLRQSNDR